MIVARRPFLLYDVDLIAIGVLVGIVAAFFATVYAPLRASDRSHRTLAGELALSEERARLLERRLADARDDNARLASAVAGAREQAPGSTALTGFVDLLTSRAADCGIDVTQVRPEGATPRDGLLVGRITVVGRGRGSDFMNLLQILARENRYHSVADVSVTRAVGDRDDLCALSWSHFVHMLPDSVSPAGSTP